MGDTGGDRDDGHAGVAWDVLEALIDGFDVLSLVGEVLRCVGHLVAELLGLG